MTHIRPIRAFPWNFVILGGRSSLLPLGLLAEMTKIGGGGGVISNSSPYPVKAASLKQKCIKLRQRKKLCREIPNDNI